MTVLAPEPHRPSRAPCRMRARGAGCRTPQRRAIIKDRCQRGGDPPASRIGGAVAVGRKIAPRCPAPGTSQRQWQYVPLYRCSDTKFSNAERSPSATTSGSVGPNTACMCGNGCMSRDNGFQSVRAAGKKLQIRTLFF
jgi:hypothetical protein